MDMTKRMEALIYLMAGLAGGTLFTWLWARARVDAQRMLLQMKEEELVRARAAADVQAGRMEELARENKALAADKQAVERELVLLRRQMEQERTARQAQFEEQLCRVEAQLRNATQEVLRQRTEELTGTNSTQLNAIIGPLKDSLRDMKAAMDNSRDANNRNTASLEKAIEEVMKRTGDIGREADKLAHALKNESKVQGNWGELILDEILASQGLTEGIHYEKQVTMRDTSGRALRNEESGRRMIPDTILHYPDGKDAILDSKVSLTAFVDYRNAETDAERDEALTRHVKSIRNHVAELARKDYSAYVKPPRQALGYVIMFVPNEAALQLALYNDAALWRDAFGRGVFITSEQNLLAALRMIQVAWTQTRQAQNQEQIFDTARMLLDRVADFIKLFDDMGQRLHDATVFYTKAADKLRDGRQSVVGASNRLIKLGARMSARKHLPEENEPMSSSLSSEENGERLE
ncbi:MAG: DNA recombination protein RmuC [Paraprevotella sp.]|nr:DNA recombination protein RmuC [Paraprevotella sp.]